MKPFGIFISALAMMTTLLAHSAHAKSHPPLFDLGTLGGEYSSANAVNNKGQIVGASCTSGQLQLGGDGPSCTLSGELHAFIWENGMMTDLGTLGGTYSIAYGINDLGDVVGESKNSLGEVRAFIWHNGVMSDLGTMGFQSNFAAAYAINVAGQVVGELITSGGGIGYAFIWQNGAMTDIGTLYNPRGSGPTPLDINDRGQVVGTDSNTSGSWSKAFIWENGVMTDLGDLTTCYQYRGTASHINNRGQVVGYSDCLSGWSMSFIWQQGVITPLGSVVAKANNNRGDVVGESETSSGNSHAFFLRNGVMRDLGTLFGGNSVAKDISDKGVVVGDSDGHAFLWRE